MGEAGNCLWPDAMKDDVIAIGGAGNILKHEISGVTFLQESWQESCMQ